MSDSIRFISALPFSKADKEGFITTIWDGATDRWGDKFTPEIEARIQAELDTFEQIEGYMAYLYFVWRVVSECHFFTMPYRTLAHASAVCYALGITAVDPIGLKLDFNRFIQTDKPRFAEIGLAADATATQIQTDIQNLSYDNEQERLGTRVWREDVDNALRIYPSQRTAQLLGYFDEFVDFNLIPFDDAATYATLLRSDDLSGVYGCNPTTVLQHYLQQAKPQFEDLIPLCTASIMDFPTNRIYASRKYGIEPKSEFAPEIEAILSETCGEVLYNEQLYAIAALVGYTPSEAEQLRKVLGKRQSDQYAYHEGNFGDHPNLFDKLLNEASWSFPKAAMAEFARLVYITAYLKTHYPTKFAQVALWVAASEDY